MKHENMKTRQQKESRQQTDPSPAVLFAMAARGNLRTFHCHICMKRTAHLMTERGRVEVRRCTVCGVEKGSVTR